MITEVYVVVVVDNVGKERVAVLVENNEIQPLVFGEYQNLLNILPSAQLMADQTNHKIRVVRFTTREVTHEINPEKTPD